MANDARFLEWFWDRVIIRGDADCWPWTGSRNGGKFGHGRVRVRVGERLYFTGAHRIAWELSNAKEIPQGMYACHHCDNPPCCNPKHIFIGTPSDNSRDCVSKKRHYISTGNPKVRGTIHPKSKFTPEKIREIRARRDEPRIALAEEFGTSRRYINHIIGGLRWKWLDAKGDNNEQA